MFALLLEVPLKHLMIKMLYMQQAWPFLVTLTWDTGSKLVGKLWDQVIVYSVLHWPQDNHRPCVMDWKESQINVGQKLPALRIISRLSSWRTKQDFSFFKKKKIWASSPVHTDHSRKLNCKHIIYKWSHYRMMFIFAYQLLFIQHLDPP